MHVDGSIEHLVVAAADRVEELIAAQHAARRARELPQEVELEGGQGERPTAGRGFARRRVAAVIDDRRVTARSRARSSRVEKVFGR